MSLKEKVLNRSNSYNHYKKENEALSKALKKEIKKNKDDIKSLTEEINTLKESQKRNEEILDSYYAFFSNLYLDYDLKPKGALKNTQDLCQELLDFVDKVCKKHDLEYWLDYGNLLGAVRHKGFIPWDDDFDLGMMREDSIKFLSIIQDEVNLHGLDDILEVNTIRKTSDGKGVMVFTQLKVHEDFSDEKNLFAGLDVFASDYIIDPGENIEEEFKRARYIYHKNFKEGLEREEVLKLFYEQLNLSFEEQEYLIPPIDIWGGMFKFKLFRRDKLFPLREIEFNGKLYPCPNDCDYHLENIYGKNFMDIPQIVKRHKRVSLLKEIDNYEEKYEEYLRRFKEVNENFKY
ncbi:MAG: LicD family protein [Methanobrevibacter sp.]|nr:LicD family protein [Methanobrevibacter sp.]